MHASTFFFAPHLRARFPLIAAIQQLGIHSFRLADVNKCVFITGVLLLRLRFLFAGAPTRAGRVASELMAVAPGNTAVAFIVEVALFFDSFNLNGSP